MQRNSLLALSVSSHLAINFIPLQWSGFKKKKKNGAGDGFGEGMAQMGQLQTKQLENQHVRRWWAETQPKPQQSVNQYTRFLSYIIIGFYSSSMPVLSHSTQVQMGPTSWNAMGRLAPWHFKSIWLASLDSLIEWEKKNNLRGQGTDTAFQNSFVHDWSSALCVSLHQLSERPKKEKGCQRPVCQHIMVPPSETLSTPRVGLCAGREWFSSFGGTDRM